MMILRSIVVTTILISLDHMNIVAHAKPKRKAVEMQIMGLKEQMEMIVSHMLITQYFAANTIMKTSMQEKCVANVVVLPVRIQLVIYTIRYLSRVNIIGFTHTNVNSMTLRMFSIQKRCVVLAKA